MQYRVTWSAALYAGVAAGILATLVQIALWSIFADVLPTILFRDARFTAAIVMGRAVLPPPATFDGGIMLVATLVHFALSIIYGLSLSWVIARPRAAPSLLVGAIFGLAVYGMNMYGTFEPSWHSQPNALTVASFPPTGGVRIAELLGPQSTRSSLSCV